MKEKRKPKKILINLMILALIMFSAPLSAISDCQVTLQWDPNNPAPAGYRIYGRTAGYAYDYDAPWWEGDYTFTQATLDQLDENTTYYFIVRAFDADDNESGDSNEVRFNYNNPEADTDAGLINHSAGSSGGGGAGCFLDSLMGSR
jgi:hypothetical protein